MKDDPQGPLGPSGGLSSLGAEDPADSGLTGNFVFFFRGGPKIFPVLLLDGTSTKIVKQQIKLSKRWLFNTALVTSIQIWC